MVIQVDRRAVYVLLGILLLGVPLALGLWLGGALGQSPTAAPAAAPPAAAPQAAAPDFSAGANGAPGAAAPQPQADSALDALPRIEVEAAHLLLGDANTIFVDTRVKEAYDQSHIKGAISVPEMEITTRTTDLPKDKDLVLYCTCPNEEEAARSVQALIGIGYTRVKVLEGGMQKWDGMFPDEIVNAPSGGAAPSTGNSIQVQPAAPPAQP